MKTLKHIFLSLIAIIALMYTYSANSANTGELDFSSDWNTIMELKENIDVLNEKDSDIDVQYDELNTDYEIKTFLRKDLTLIELNRIRTLVKEYNVNNIAIELELFEKAKIWESVVDIRKELLEEKRKLYSWLIPFIDSDFDSEYIEYIKWDAKLFNDKEDVKEDKIVQQEILESKVELIELKIQEHRDFINESIQQIIETRLDEKIQNLSNNETFKQLVPESKIKVLDKTIEKIQAKLDNLESTYDVLWTWSIVITDSNYLDKKIKTYKIAVLKLEEFRDSIK